MNLIIKILTRLTIQIGTVALLVELIVSGCGSMDKAASASFASVVIANQTPEKIRQAAIAVFQANGYNIFSQSGDGLVFQREATRREVISYAGFVGAHEGEQVVIRVRVNIRPNRPGVYLVEGKAYAVSNPQQGVFEKTTALFNYQSDPYQKLLEQIPLRLVLSTPAP